MCSELEGQVSIYPQQMEGHWLIAFCREHIAHCKCPRTIDFASEVPRTETGKMAKRRLREKYWAGHTSRLV